MIRKKLKRASGWALFAGWILFGASCSQGQRPSPETAMRAALGIVEVICPPEITVGDCAYRVKAWLPAQASLADAGTE